MEVSDGDSIKLGRDVLVSEMSGCGSIGCLSCQGKQSTSSLLSSSGRSLLINIIGFIFLIFSGGGVRGGLN